MRLWSIHPRYLDCRGLVATWREGLLARKVLMGKTRGYKNHPQLERFRISKDPIAAIDTYLLFIWNESRRRCYNFDRSKIGSETTEQQIDVTTRQLGYEFGLLKSKIKKRDPTFYRVVAKIKRPEPNPLFNVKEGPLESWERIRNER